MSTGVRPEGLESLDMNGLAKFMASKHCKCVCFLTGAGVSVAAGIPDFRSPGGMYDTLRPELLTATPRWRDAMAAEPTTVVSWELFRQNQLPYLEVRRPFIKGVADKKWSATQSHFFVRCCHDHGLLRRLYTQNIDGLDFLTGVPSEKLISVHGTMGTVSCEFCKTPMDLEEFRSAVSVNIKDIYDQDNDDDAPAASSPVLCTKCGKAGVKPDTVLYGRSLPERFFDHSGVDMADLDLLIVAGTSLTVSPANSLVEMVPKSCVRVVVNMEPVGEDLGIVYGPGATRDIFLQGRCDDVFLKLAEKLGWKDDLLKRCGGSADEHSS